MEQNESCNKHKNKTHEQLSQKGRDFLLDDFSIMLYSCIEHTRMYVSASEFSPSPTIDYWEEV